MIRLSPPDLAPDSVENLEKAISENWISASGPYVERVERQLAAKAARRYCVATITGSAALELALKVVGVGKNSVVAVPDFTFSASINAILNVGAQPLICDVENDYMTLDAQKLGCCVGDFEVNAIVAVDVLGYGCDYPKLNTCLPKKVPIIADASGSLGSDYYGQPAGKFGDVAVFSFNGNKVITCGQGGCLLTDNEELYIKAKLLANQGRLTSEYISNSIGHNYRMSSINAALLEAQLSCLDTFIAKRLTIKNFYDENIHRVEKIHIAAHSSERSSNGWLYSVRCADREAAADLVEHLKCDGVESKQFWTVLSEQPAFKNVITMPLQNSKKFSQSLVSLPSSSRLTIDELSQVVHSIKKWTQK